jgi:hypothetical protein
MSQDDLIWHYTSVHGLKGIIEGKQIHCTNALFLNDLKEHQLVYHFFSEAIHIFMDECSDADAKELLCKCIRGLARFFSSDKQHLTPYVASFSKKDDLLSQWMGYAQGQGYSLGFSKNALEEQTMNGRFKLVDVEYVDDSVIPKSINLHMETFLDTVKGFIEYNTAYKKNLETVASNPMQDVNLPSNRKDDLMMIQHSWQISLTTKALELSPKYKDKAFLEEDEVRLYASEVHKNEKLEDLRSFRTTKNIIKPYTIFPLNLSALKTIRIGPTSNKELTALGVSTLLDAYNLTDVNIQHSTIPYRTWD